MPGRQTFDLMLRAHVHPLATSDKPRCLTMTGEWSVEEGHGRSFSPLHAARISEQSSAHMPMTVGISTIPPFATRCKLAT